MSLWSYRDSLFDSVRQSPFPVEIWRHIIRLTLDSFTDYAPASTPQLYLSPSTAKILVPDLLKRVCRFWAKEIKLLQDKFGDRSLPIYRQLLDDLNSGMTIPPPYPYKVSIRNGQEFPQCLKERRPVPRGLFFTSLGTDCRNLVFFF
jgi:hypothetical protein